MTFLPIFGNLRKVCALDCGKITLSNEKIQFVDSLMDKRLYFAIIRCGFKSRSISFFLLSFNLLVFILDFVYIWIYLFESGIRSFNKYTRRNVNIFIKPKCNNCLFDLILYVPSTIFQLNSDGSSWVEPVLS